ncbi:XRE family transcriptional regulator [Psychroflexus aestuariivivens]|uniref:XRE family transcriptional regulator n=1 Tax=Psychroflexus aestuariivivens TaxID=1795040 RepID=UPI000FD8B308|nr:XRE family transcriptional regulator [Psychroflexus aestuariivivens]
MNELEYILKNKKLKGYSWDDLSKDLPISGNGLRLAFNRGSVKKEYLEVIKNIIFSKSEQNAQNTQSVVSDKEVNYIENNHGNKYVELPNGKYMIQAPKVPYKAYASFIEVFEDEYELHNTFGVSYFTVDKIGLGKYIAFNTGNDSMNGGGINDTPNGAEVLGRELGRHHWPDGFRPTDYGWIIVSKDGIFHKDIEDSDVEGKIICKSRNPSPEFPDFSLILDDVHSIWKVIKRTF